MDLCRSLKDCSHRLICYFITFRNQLRSSLARASRECRDLPLLPEPVFTNKCQVFSRAANNICSKHGTLPVS